ncbi:hypothetical protein FOLKNPGA_02758 [Legionella sp. PC1000]|nr:hypothetical protein FOLKNPGA_02758 [Legionella sp. PC1000]
MRLGVALASYTSPPVNSNPIGKPQASTAIWIFVVLPTNGFPNGLIFLSDRIRTIRCREQVAARRRWG